MTPHAPDEEFDHSVLDRIEQSPNGIVPTTPAYQDALKRLYASHQLYASAEHKDGHVTARSLNGRPSFLAANLADLALGRVGAEALEPNSGIFERYVRSLPQALQAPAESFRVKAAGRPVHHRAKHVGADKLPVPHDLLHTVFLVPGSGPHPGLPGSYLYGSVLQVGADGADGSWAVHVHDRDDGAAVYETSSMRDALAKVEELAGCAPFKLEELVALGFHLT